MKKGYQIVDEEEDIQEPVTLEDQKSYSKMDADYNLVDGDLTLLITAAREVLEQQLNIGLVRREVELQWDGRTLELPLSPTGDVASVKIGDKTLVANTDYAVDDYKAKTIYINGIAGNSGCSFFYGNDGTVEISTSSSITLPKAYKAVYNTGYEYGKLPSKLKEAIMAQCDWMYRNRGTNNGADICDEAWTLAKSYSRNLVL